MIQRRGWSPSKAAGSRHDTDTDDRLASASNVYGIYLGYPRVGTVLHGVTLSVGLSVCPLTIRPRIQMVSPHSELIRTT